MDYGPQLWTKSYREHPDGSMECVCFWCNETMLFYPGDTVCVVETKSGEFAGLQCERCKKTYAGRHALYPARRS